MNATRMIEIAAQLAALYKTRAELSLREWQYEKDAEGRKLYLTPLDGWPGKNAEDRKLAAERVFGVDEVLSKIAAAANLVHAELAQCEALIAGLEAERRALEYTVKIALVETLQAKHYEYAPGQDAFEQVEGVELDQAAYSYAEDEFPF